jgi:hypothetical protein
MIFLNITSNYNITDLSDNYYYHNFFILSLFLLYGSIKLINSINCEYDLYGLRTTGDDEQ